MASDPPLPPVNAKAAFLPGRQVIEVDSVLE
jgi:hypothetical protein